MTKTNVPRLRFKGFSGEWKEKELRKISDSFSGGTPSVNDKDNYGGDIPFIRSSDINDDVFELYLTNKGLKNSSAKLVQKGTLLIALYGATSGKTGIARIDGAINQAVLAILPKENFDKLYIYDLLNYKKSEIVNKYIQGGQGNLSGKIINNLKYFYPDCIEQKKNGSFFAKIDKLIELQTLKLELLKKLKRGYLQKMFPQDGESAPRLRFSGFSGEWKKLSVKDIGTVVTGNTPSKKDKSNYGGENLWITPSDIDIDSTYLSDSATKLSDKGKEISKIIPKNSVLVTCIASIGKNALNGCELSINQQINAVIPNEKFDSYFLLNLSNQWSIEMNRLTSNASLKIINRTEFSKLETLAPEFEEQQKIGSFLSKLDQMINNQSDKIKSLQQEKKSYLQKMFI